jgi:hypothetical protein
MKVLILCLVLAICSQVSVAQVSFGVKGGLNANYVTFRFQGERQTSSGLDFHLGGYVNIPLNKKFSFRPELQFSRRGNDYYKLDYIELPLLLSYSPIKFMEIELGTNVGYLLSKNATFFSLNDFNRLDVGLTSGLRFNLPKGFFIASRYYYGFSSFLSGSYRALNSNDPLITNSGDNNFYYYNRTIQLSIGYKIK